MINELSDQYLFLNPCINDHSFQISKFKLEQLVHILETETTEIKSSLYFYSYNNAEYEICYIEHKMN